MIPKKIHIFWFGRKPYPYPEYLSLLKRFHHGWEINVWNEDNIDKTVLHSRIRKIVNSPNVSPNYKSDCCRFNYVQKIGGVHVDPDFEFFKPIDDNILNCESFCGYAYKHWKTGYRHPNSGLFGTIKNGKWINNLVKEFIKKINDISIDSLCKMPVINLNMTEELLKCEKIYEPEYFHMGDKNLESYSKHHWGGSSGWYKELKNE